MFSTQKHIPVGYYIQRDVYNILLHATMQVLQEDKYDQIILQMKYVNTFLKKCPIFLEYLSNYK